MSAREHQNLIKANIAEAEKRGDYAHAETLKRIFAALLAIVLE